MKKEKNVKREYGVTPVFYHNWLLRLEEAFPDHEVRFELAVTREGIKYNLLAIAKNPKHRDFCGSGPTPLKAFREMLDQQ